MIADRLKKIMGTMSARKFAEALEMSPTTLQEYLKGRTPPADFIERVCVRFGIDSWWLLSGKGPVYRDMTTDLRDPETIYQSNSYLDPQIREMVSIMLDLDQDTRDDLLRQAKKEKKRMELERKLERMEGFTDPPKSIGGKVKSKKGKLLDV